MLSLPLAATLLLSLTPIRAKGTTKRDGAYLNEQTIRLPVDHFNSSNTDTYSNRFWLDLTHYKPGGPVVVFNHGESGVGSGVLKTYFGANASNMAIVRRYNGIAVIWEHRYYGKMSGSWCWLYMLTTLARREHTSSH